MSLVGRPDRQFHLLRAGLVVNGQSVSVIMGHHDIPLISRIYRLSAYYQGDFGNFG